MSHLFVIPTKLIMVFVNKIFKKTPFERTKSCFITGFVVIDPKFIAS